jgi:hypothetical protein
MKMTVIGLFESETLEETVTSLEAAGVTGSQISVVTQPGPIQERLGGDAQQTVLESAGAGAVGGVALGGLVGILAAASQILIPGIGAAFGGFLGALIGLGMSEEDAHLYVEGVYAREMRWSRQKSIQTRLLQPWRLCARGGAQH